MKATPTHRPEQVTHGTPAPYLAHSASSAVVIRDKLLRTPQVEALTGCSKSTIYTLMKDGKFPKNIAVTRRMVGWSEAAVLTWIQERLQGGAA